MLSIGIDFGTSNSSAAVYDGDRVRLLDLDPGAPDPRVMRSLVYIERSGEVSYGAEALRRYLEQNTGRPVRYELRRVGEITMTFAEIGTLVKDAFALVDANETGRLFQSLKRFLPLTSFQATNVFGHNFTVEELLSLLARRILDAARESLGREPDTLTVGWPVRFSTEGEAEALARRRLRDAWRLAGAGEVRFVEEPAAAIRQFAVETETRQEETVLVFDFGGGTLDICVARLRGGGVETLATAGVALGGDLLDGRIVESQLTPLFGENARYRSTGLPLPRYLFNRLRSWQTLVELNRPEHFELILRAKHECDQPRELANLETLVARNYGRAFFQAVERTKVALSSSQWATVRLQGRGIDIEQPLSRSQFESAISRQLKTARDCVDEALTAAGLASSEVDLVLTTGGSSLIPAFQRMLRATLSRARLQESDAFTSVAAGLAVAGYQEAAVPL
jgi:hypothetical chaperone protein